jgi:hypothetical protein
MKVKIIGLLVAVVLVAAMVAVAARATSAYFSESKSGTITGTIGDIRITTSGGAVGQGDGINFFWDEMLPGVVYNAPVTVQNTSSSNSEDLWIHFNNLTALSALNQLGKYGAVTIDVGGTPVFQSASLNDNTARGNTIGNNGALPEWVQLATNVGPTASRVVTFKFAYASKMKQPEPGSVFNKYPVLAIPGNECLNGDAYWNGTAFLTMPMAAEGALPTTLYPTNAGPGTGTGLPAWNGTYSYYAQVTVRTVDGSGNGLPFQIVATQPGISPTDGGTNATIIP